MKLKLLLCAPLLLAVVACAGSGDEEKEDRSRELYNRSVRLMKSYIDSLRHLPDTVDVAGLMRRYEERMAALNMEFPPGTDMLMTPDLNDNLFKLTRVLTRLRMRHPGGMELIVDTLTGDTIDRHLPTPEELAKEAEVKKKALEAKAAKAKKEAAAKPRQEAAAAKPADASPTPAAPTPPPADPSGE